MRYFQEMKSKWGFSEGSSTPRDAWLARDVYCRVTNVLARKLGSAYRIVPFDRPGMHNGCMICYVPADKIKDSVVLDARWADKNWQLVNEHLTDDGTADQAMEDAVVQAYELELDSYLTVKVTADKKSLNKLLKKLEKKK